MGNAIQFGIYRFFFLLVGLLICNFSLAQKVDILEDSTDKLDSYTYIQNLKKGALIVRLRINSKKVEAYRNAGNEDLALKLEAQQKEKNLNMLLAFKNNFTFCPVYFIYADDYNKVLAGEKNGYFINESLEVDSSIIMDKVNYLFCDFGPVFVQAIENQIDPKNKVVTSTPAFQEALVIKDHSLTQLLDPFPFYVKVRIYEFDNAALKLNDTFFAHLSKSWTKIKKEDE